MRDAFVGAVLDRHFGGRKQAREVDEQLARDDDCAVTFDLRGERRAQRELHVGGGELEPVAVRPQQDAGEDLHRSAGRNDARNGRELRNELIAVDR